MKDQTSALQSFSVSPGNTASRCSASWIGRLNAAGSSAGASCSSGQCEVATRVSARVAEKFADDDSRWKQRTSAPSVSGSDRRLRGEALGGASFGLCGFFLAILGRGGGFEGTEKPLGNGGDFLDGGV